ncbi:UrcA family protein [Caulobacter sp. UNC358MFTsu5.1]|uniref:UrcA family protein n=1 Tax=Caulobacter sp. UNC358MFTsu5.1 TaxID=1449049 RepID=UPI0004A6E05B|nr:UrcA family protein [Caulobacter sp. UNC358MFTsu5.1]
MGQFIAKFSTVALLGLAVLPALGLTQAAQAAPVASRSEEPAVLARIPIGDLDVSRPDHARLLKARVDTATAAVCDARIRAQRLDRWSAAACRIDVRDEVASKLSAPQLRALRSVGG